MKYRKKPIEIEAIQWDGLNLSDIEKFSGDNLAYDMVIEIKTCWVGDQCRCCPREEKITNMKIRTLDGDIGVDIGDYIIKGIQSELYPCSPSMFEDTYEKV